MRDSVCHAFLTLALFPNGVGNTNQGRYGEKGLLRASGEAEFQEGQRYQAGDAEDRAAVGFQQKADRRATVQDDFFRHHDRSAHSGLGSWRL